MRNRVGPAVSGGDFFKRPGEIKKIWRAIESDTHILMSAPRRVGKTSILFHLLENQKNNYCCIYIITQSIANENDFYKRIYMAIVDCQEVSSHTTRLSAKSKELLGGAVKRIKSVKAGGIGGIDLTAGSDADYNSKFIKLIRSLQLDDTKIIMMIDEFAQTIENIRRTEGDDKAIHFLQTVREVR